MTCKTLVIDETDLERNWHIT